LTACAGSTDEPSAFAPDRGYDLRREVALRPEPFGALAYDYRTRRLTFVHSRLLCTLLQSLGRFASAREAAEALTDSPSARRKLLAALEKLVSLDLVHAR
jgi:mycofactocin biosynthesis protein MftB